MAVSRRNFRRLTGRKDKRSGVTIKLFDYRRLEFSILRAFDLRIYAFQTPDQKLKVATKSMRRFAVVPGENGNP